MQSGRFDLVALDSPVDKRFKETFSLVLSGMVVIPALLFLSCEIAEPNPIYHDIGSPPVVETFAIGTVVPGQTLTGDLEITLPDSLIPIGLWKVDFAIDSTIVQTEVLPPYMVTVDLRPLTPGNHYLIFLLYYHGSHGLGELFGATPDVIYVTGVTVDHTPPAAIPVTGISWGDLFPTITWQPGTSSNFIEYLVRRHARHTMESDVIVARIRDKTVTSFTDSAMYAFMGNRGIYSIGVSNGDAEVFGVSMEIEIGVRFPQDRVYYAIDNPVNGEVYCLAMTGELLAVSSQDDQILRRLNVTAGAGSLALNDAGDRIFHCSSDFGPMRVYDASTFAFVKLWTRDFSITPRGYVMGADSIMYVVGDFGSIKVLNAYTGVELYVLAEPFEYAARQLLRTPDGQSLFQYVSNHKVIRYDISSGLPVKQEEYSTGGREGWAMSPSGSLLTVPRVGGYDIFTVSPFAFLKTLIPPDLYADNTTFTAELSDSFLYVSYQGSGGPMEAPGVVSEMDIASGQQLRSWRFRVIPFVLSRTLNGRSLYSFAGPLEDEHWVIAL